MSVIFVMAIQVRERSVEAMREKLATMVTALNKISYLESALTSAGSSFEIKRFIWSELAFLYAERKMFERAARAFQSLASLEPMFRERMDAYVMAAEMYCRLGKIDDAEHMFTAAVRDASEEGKRKVLLARKNVYFKFARDLTSSGKRASGVKFYEKLNKMKLDEIEKTEVLAKLKESYNALGMFREAKLLLSG